MMIREVVESFLATKASEGKAADTLRYYQLQLPGFAAFLLGRGYTDLCEVKRGDLRDYFLEQRRSGVHQPTIAARATAVSALLHWAVEEELAGEELLRKVRFPRQQTSAIVPFTRDQVQSLLLVSRRGGQGERNYAILLVLLDTGMRAAELCSLRDEWAGIDRIRVFGKRSKWRNVPISPTTVAAIEEWRLYRGGSPWLFTAPTGKALGRKALLMLFWRLGRAANLTGVRCSPHTMRHTFAVTFLRNGGDLLTLQRILGHTDLNMTRRYVALVDEDIQAAHRRHSPVQGLLAR